MCFFIDFTFTNPFFYIYGVVDRNWLEEDLPPQEMPDSQVRPLHLEDCDTEVKFFLKMFGSNNLELLTVQSNLQRAKTAIEKNKNIPAFSEKEIRQCIGILMYIRVECGNFF